MSKKSPQLRFEGFTDDWEQRKLGDVISISSEKNGNQFSRADVLSVSREAGVVNQIEYQGRSFAGASIANYRVVHKGDLIYTKSPLKGAPNGIFKTSEAEGIVSPLYAVYQSREANAAFVGWLLSNDNFATHYLYPLVNKGSKNTLLVSDADAISGHLSFPNIEEQAKIVSFFTQLDNLIALHQRKLDLLKEQKKGYLQKMFPKNGAKVPELRFAGFADDWEQRKLKEVANHRGGTAIEKYFSKNGKYKVISIGSYGLNSKYIDQGIRAVSNDITDVRVVRKGELTMVLNDKTSNGTIIGRSLLIDTDNEYVINQRTEILSPKENFDSSFAYITLNGPFREKVRKIVQGGTQIYVNYPVVENLKLELPDLEEQKKIGTFFKHLEDTIALHQRKLDLLKEQKKGFLQKMFV